MRTLYHATCTVHLVRGHFASFTEKLECTLKGLARHSNKNIFFLGDSNINLLEYGHNEKVTKYVDLFAEYGFASTISRPTRITCHSTTLIDHIFVNNCHAVTKSGIISESISDHLATFTCILLDANRIGKKLQNDSDRQQTRIVNDENIATFENEIASIDWNFLNEIDGTNEKFNAFEKKYQEVYDKCFPVATKKINRRKNSKPWILDWLQCACDRKNKLYMKFVKAPTNENETTYKRMKKFVEKHVNIAKNKYYASYFKKHSSNSKLQWQMINQMLNKKSKEKIKISKIKYKGEVITNSQQIANSFNDYFTNIAENLKNENNLARGVRPGWDHLSRISRCTLDMELEDTSQSEIAEIIQDLKNKSTSDMSILPLKRVRNVLSPVISHLISISLQEGIFPTKLKRAKVIPLHIGGSRSEITNYRPISLLSCFSKIFEKVMQARLVKHLKAQNILYASQYGFRAGHSCEHALLEAQYRIHQALERKQVSALLLLDFSKAFDLVDSDILLHKLEHYGVRGLALSWFNSYLTNRRQYVHVNNCDSGEMSLRHGVPQGSILGPILFIIYINDLPNISDLAKYIFFADDANIIVSADTYSELNIHANSILNSVQTWVADNGLKLNIAKTKYMIFSNKSPSDINISIGGQRLVQSEHERFLGVIIDSKLSWAQHIRQLKTKISRNAGVMIKLKNIIPHKAQKMLYNSLIQSHLYYCACVWGTKSFNSIKSLFSAQKKAIRATDVLYHNYFYDKKTDRIADHSKPIFNKLELLALPNLIAKSCLTLMHKIYLGVAPRNISNIFELTKNCNVQSRRDPLYFTNKYNRLSIADNSISYKGTRLYNNTVNEVNKTLPSNALKLQDKFINTFKSAIVKHLFEIQKIDDQNDTWSNNNFILFSL